LCCDKDQRITEAPIEELTALPTERYGPALTFSVRVALGHKGDPSDKVLSSVLNGWPKHLAGEGHFTELTFDFESSLALHSATDMGEEALVKLMLDAGANVNWRNNVKMTALHLAAKKGHEATVRLLLKHKADVDAKDTLERTALHLAAEEGHEAVVRLLLEYKADVDAKATGKWTALHIAAGNGHEAMMSLLLEKGADIEMKDFSGGTPLAVAIDNGSEAVIKLLLAKGAKVDYLYKLICYGFYFPGEEGEVPPIELYIQRKFVYRGLLVEGGTLRNKLPRESGENFLYSVLVENPPEDEDLEVGHVPYVIYKPRGYKSGVGRVETPLSHATLRRNEAVVKLLVDHCKANGTTVRDEDMNMAAELLADTI
jgi:hypothetical protein